MTSTYKLTFYEYKLSNGLFLVALQYAIAVRETQGNEDNWTEVPGREVRYKMIRVFLLHLLSKCILDIPVAKIINWKKFGV